MWSERDHDAQMGRVLNESSQDAQRNFESCELAGRLTNRYGIQNLTISDHPEVFVCRNLRQLGRSSGNTSGTTGERPAFQ
jgi:hypothetical protein